MQVMIQLSDPAALSVATGYQYVCSRNLVVQYISEPPAGFHSDFIKTSGLRTNFNIVKSAAAVVSTKYTP